MTFAVWHTKTDRDERGRVTGTRGSFGWLPTTFPEDFVHVADVLVGDIDRVFEKTNHIDHSWTENSGVVLAAGANPHEMRSTSVGDVIVSADGAFVVAPVGLRRVEPGVAFTAGELRARPPWTA